jgi:4-hydroxy-3-polyprenylbenzoate decarboxylase
MAVYVVGVTGASGAPYARRLLQALLESGHEVKLVVTESGERVLAIELDLRLDGPLDDRAEQWRSFLGRPSGDPALELFHLRDMAASISSGSFPTSGMVVIPCSMGTLARIAAGVSSTLVERAADVTMKERRPLVLVPRESPLNEVHLENMLRLRRAGVDILPAAPGFYHRPRSIDDLVDFVVARVLDRLGVENQLFRRWTGDAPELVEEQ